MVTSETVELGPHVEPTRVADDDAGREAAAERPRGRKRAAVGSPFPQWLLNVGFACGLVLAGVCLLFSAFYLYYFLTNTSAAVENMLKAEILGIKGEMDLDAGSESYKVKIARLSPGVFVILCATVLIGVCATSSTPFREGQHVRETTEPVSELDAYGAADTTDMNSAEDAGATKPAATDKAINNKNSSAKPARGYVPPDPGPVPTR